MIDYMRGINYDDVSTKIMDWVSTLSERTLYLSAIALLHVAFVPNLLAYLNAITEKLPSFDTFFLINLALAILAIRSVIKKDSVAILLHMVGFISQAGLFAYIILR